jgi:hypothetical protein
MFLHHETYRLLTHERMNRYLSEAAGDRRIRLAAVGGGQEVGHRSIAAPARMLRAVLRALVHMSARKGRPVGRPAEVLVERSPSPRRY